MQNTILIIVPTLDSYLILPKLIESLNNQTSKLWRLIFVDGKSCKNHREYLENVVMKNSNISIVEEIDESPGIYGAMTTGLKYRKSNEWVLFWGSDDIAYNKYTIEDLINIINNRKFNNLDLIFNDATYIDKFGKSKRESSFKVINSNLKLSFFLGFSPPHQGCLFSPNILKVKNFYSLDYYLAADLDYFLSILFLKDISVKFHAKKIVKMSKGGASGRMIFKRLNEVILVYKKFFGILFFIPFFLRYIIRISQYIFK